MCTLAFSMKRTQEWLERISEEAEVGLLCIFICQFQSFQECSLHCSFLSKQGTRCHLLHFSSVNGLSFRG